MPYVAQHARLRLDRGGAPENVGELTYAYTMVVLSKGDDTTRMTAIERLTGAYVASNGMRFDTLAAVIGALTAARLEYCRRMGPLRADILLGFQTRFYHTIVAPYEDRKIAQNGDVYPKEEA